MIEAKLKILGKKHRGRLIPLAERRFLIGREQDCQLRPNSELVSRHHCAITMDGFTVRLLDMGSTNGTFVNDKKVRGQVTLRSGDQVRVGKLVFELVVNDLAPGEVAGTENVKALPDLLKQQAGVDTEELSAAETSHDLQVPSPSLDDTGDFEIPAIPSPDDSDAFELSDSTTNGAGTSAAISESDSAATNQADIEADTAVAQHDQLVPPPEGGPPAEQPQYPHPHPGQQPPMYGQPPVGYPTMPMPYPQAPMPYMQPGVPYMPQPMYPQAPMMYPQQPMPQQPMPMQPMPQQPMPPQTDDTLDVSDEETGTVPDLPVKLPDPSETGATDPEPPRPKTAEGEKGSEESQAPEPIPSESAADIIKQYVQRRPDV